MNISALQLTSLNIQYTAVCLKPLHGKVQLFEACLWRKHLRHTQRCLQ